MDNSNLIIQTLETSPRKEHRSLFIHREVIYEYTFLFSPYTCVVKMGDLARCDMQPRITFVLSLDNRHQADSPPYNNHVELDAEKDATGGAHGHKSQFFCWLSTN